MKKVIASFVVAASIGVTGCNQGTPGGPGTVVPNSNKTVGQAEDTFRLDLPNLSTKIMQGETKSVTLGIKRGTNFKEDVAVKFVDLPKGVTVEPAEPVIKAGDADAKVNVKAADDAALGDFTVKVTGHPTKGTDATNDLKLTVDKK